jgi:hypothetical protein
MDDEAIDGEAVEIPAATEAPEPQHEVTARPLPVPAQPTQLLRPMATPEEAADMMAEYQRTVRAVLDPSDYQEAERGKKFVKKSGWRKIAKAYGLSVEIISVEVERDEEGHATRATVVVRATAPNGQTQDGDGYCSIEEGRFSRSSGRQKLENDLRATATTRAKNRAISDLVGMGEVSAEEVGSLTHTPAEQPFADTDEILKPLSNLVTPADAERLLDWLRTQHGGLIPNSVGRAVQATARLASRHECSPDRSPFATPTERN